MPLNNYDPYYQGTKSKIVSEENGRKHIGLNPNGYTVTHYRVDGVILRDQKACDYILMNESKSIAYLIELKGRSVEKAAEQLKATAEALGQYLGGYKLQFRIVCSQSRTHNVISASARKIIDAWTKAGQFCRRTNELQENI